MSTSDVNQSMATLFMPEQASPPIPAAGTADACALYCDGTNLMLSVNGGAYAAISTGGGASTLNAAYANGPAGNTIAMTDALGAVTLSSARTTDSILAITTTNAPATVTGSITAVAIDMSSLGTAATPATVNLPAVTIVGAHSSVAKARGAALVQMTSAYRNASATSIMVRNKQSLAGSLVQVGWDSTNYEGAPATASILVGTTHVLTIDGQTNVDAATNNVEFVGARVLVPATESSSARILTLSTLQKAGDLVNVSYTGATSLSGTSVGVRVDMSTGVTASTFQVVGHAVLIPASSSASTRGMTITSLQTASGSSVAELLLSAGATSNANVMSIVAGSTHQAVSAVTGYMVLGEQQGAAGRGARLYTSGFSSAFSGGNLLSVNRTGTWSGGGTESISLAEVVRDTSVTSSASITTAPLLALYDGPTNTTGTLTQSNNNLTITRATARSSGTVNLSGSLIGLVHAPTGTIGTDATALITGTTISKSGTVVGFTSTATLTGSLTMLALTASGATPGVQTILGADVAIPASSSASTRAIKVASTQTGSLSAGIEVGMTPGSSAAVHGFLATMGGNTADGGAAFRAAVSGASLGLYVLHSAAATSGAPANLNVVSESGAVTGTRNGRTFLVGRDNSFAATGTYAIGEACIYYAPSVSSGTYTGNQYALLIQSAPSQSGGTMNLSDVLLDISHTPTGTIASDTTTGLRVTMTPSGAQAVVGASITMAANANGAALTIAHAGTNANQLVFTSAVDGTGSHVYGPTTGTLTIKAGQRTDAGAGRSVDIFAATGLTTGAGGSVNIASADGVGTNQNAGDISLQTGAATGAGVKGHVDFVNDAVALGGGAAATLGTIGGSGPATAGQNQWLEVKVGGAVRWIPAWA